MFAFYQFIGEAFQLVFDQAPCTVANLHHAFHAVLGSERHFYPFHAAVFAVIDIAVHKRKGKVPHRRIGGDAFFRFFGEFFLLVTVVFRDVAMYIGNGVCKLVGKFCAGKRLHSTFLFAVLRAFLGQFTQHHVGMIHKVLVDGVSLLCFPKMYPIWFNGDWAVTLLQKQNVGYDARTRVGKKGIVRQADCPQEFRSFCNVFADCGVLFVHRTR